MHTILCRFLILSLSVSATAATHSAWSSAIPWDAVSAVASPVPIHFSNQSPVFDISSQGGKVLICIKPEFMTGFQTISIYNTAGKVLTRSASVSSNTVMLDLSKNGRMIPAGIYLTRLQIGQAVYKKEFIIAQ